ncbi:glycosyltransferase family 1 protein [Sporolactobacillus sp. THM7-7]|nr:glycosyltransferase family 1 protein [Sporolactobacillus sp. THM7-7]
MKTVHIIVATGEWGQDQLRYRRHRLAEFLSQHPDTEEVVWLCPVSHRTHASSISLANGIRQWPIPDILPQKLFRFGRYYDIFYERKLRALLHHLQHFQDRCHFFLWYTFPGFPLLADLFPWDRVIYDCSDLWTSPIGGQTSFVARIRQQVIAQAEMRIINGADIIFCTSDYLRRQVIQKAGMDKARQVHTFENGVEFDLFAGEARADGVIPEGFSGTVLGYIGGIKPKLDFKLVQQAAEKKRDWLFLFVGPDGTGGRGDFQQLLHEENVRWVGSVPPRDVPKYMNHIDIGMMPYKASPYNEAVFPLKLFEFLASGKPAVGVRLPSTEKYVRDGVYAHVDSNDPEAFIRTCEQLVSVKNREDLIHERVHLAQTKDWTEIFKKMMDLL